MRVRRCKLCPATVRLVKSEKTGKTMCLELDPVPGGNVSLVQSPDGSGLVARVHGKTKKQREEEATQLTFDGEEKPLAYVVHQIDCAGWKRGERP